MQLSYHKGEFVQDSEPSPVEEEDNIITDSLAVRSPLFP